MKADNLYNKLAFNGYRVFLVEPPNWKLVPAGSLGMLSYHDFDLEKMKKVEVALGYFPNAEQIARWLADIETKASPTRIHYKPAFVNNGVYQHLWTDPDYAAKRAKHKRDATWAQR